MCLARDGKFTVGKNKNVTNRPYKSAKKIV